MTSYRTGFDRINPYVSPVWPDCMDDRFWPAPRAVTKEPTDADLIEAMVKAMKDATRQDHGGTGREPASVFSDELDILAEAAARVMLERINAAFEPCDIVIAQFGKFCETHQGPPEDCPQSALRAFADENDLK